MRNLLYLGDKHYENLKIILANIISGNKSLPIIDNVINCIHIHPIH